MMWPEAKLRNARNIWCDSLVLRLVLRTQQTNSQLISSTINAKHWHQKMEWEAWANGTEEGLWVRHLGRSCWRVHVSAKSERQLEMVRCPSQIKSCDFETLSLRFNKNVLWKLNLGLNNTRCLCPEWIFIKWLAAWKQTTLYPLGHPCTDIIKRRSTLSNISSFLEPCCVSRFNHCSLGSRTTEEVTVESVHMSSDFLEKQKLILAEIYFIITAISIPSSHTCALPIKAMRRTHRQTPAVI